MQQQPGPGDMEGQIEGDEEELGNEEGLAGADWPGEQVNTIGYISKSPFLGQLPQPLH